MLRRKTYFGPTAHLVYSSVSSNKVASIDRIFFLTNWKTCATINAIYLRIYLLQFGVQLKKDNK